MTLIDADYFNAQTKTLGLKTTFTPEADVLGVLIGEASEYVEGYCHRKFGSQTIIEQVRGKSRPWATSDGWTLPQLSSRTGMPGRRLMVDHWPIQSVTSITWEDDYGNTGTVDPSTYRILDAGMLEMKLSSDEWYRERLYTVTYVLADPVPGPVKRATALKVVDLMDPQYFPGKTKSIELISNVQEQIMLLLEDYRRERLG